MTSPPARTSADFLAVFQAHADAAGRMTFAQFMALALYDPSVGYYRQRRQRIGYGPTTDFFTASSSGPLFGELMTAACASLLAGQDLRDFHFIEIGAEAGRGILHDVAHPFASTRTIALGQPIEISGHCIVFSNELFDAQPFHRFVFRQGSWRELGVVEKNGILEIIELPGNPPGWFPRDHLDGYVVDAPLAAVDLARRIAGQSWTGLFLAIDYGKSWRELIEATPSGTARAYFRHTQSNDLLARPGEQDLTCHVCWDWLSAALVECGFRPPEIESQEAFLIHHAGQVAAAISRDEAAGFSQRKLGLMQLLHPAHLGQKFQVLHCRRGVQAPDLPGLAAAV